MTIKIMTRALNFQSAPKWQEKLGGSVIEPISRFQQHYDAAIDKLNKSEKAREIISKAAESPKTVQIMVTLEWYNMFYSPYQLLKFWTQSYRQSSLIFWNPKEYLDVEEQGRGKKADPCINLIHELGHFMQYLEDTDLYETKREQTVLLSIAGDPEGKRIDLEIEDDNVAKHEAPVATQLGEPARSRYYPR